MNSEEITPPRQEAFPRLPIAQWKSRDNVKALFSQMKEVGSGTYGNVFKAISQEHNGKLMALKRLDVEKQTEGFPITALREIKLLRGLSHRNVIGLHEVFHSSALVSHRRVYTTHLVFDYMHHDFIGLIKQQVRFQPSQVKCIMQQLLKGVAYVHQRGVIHRDIKSANLLLNHQGVVKLADFGLSRPVNKAQKYTSTVVTLWYRAPEILLGSQDYSTQIDLWSVGCFLGELLTADVLFKGDDKEKRQLDKIRQLLGSLHDHWPESTCLRFYEELCPNEDHCANTLQEYILSKAPSTSPEALDLLQGLLQYDPSRRLTAEQALAHPYFSEGVGKESEMPAIDQETHGGMNLAMHQKAAFQQQQHKFKTSFASQKGFPPYRPALKQADQIQNKIREKYYQMNGQQLKRKGEADEQYIHKKINNSSFNI